MPFFDKGLNFIFLFLYLRVLVAEILQIFMH
jgi:hypothetical protein